MTTTVSPTSANVGIGSIFQQDTTSTADSNNDVFSTNANMYLSLFLTQLKNQDPTQPFDTAQMTEQLAQLNSSQQLIQTNKNLETLIAQSKNSQASSLSSFINKEVEYLGDTFYSDGSGKSFKYYIDGADDASTMITISDAEGNTVASFTGETAEGSHDFTWDGTDSSGNQLDAGTYKVSVTTKSTSGDMANASTFLSGVVSGVDFASSSDPTIFIGDDDNRIGVDLSRVSAVLNVPVSAS